jgi:hypothetical protein
MGYFGNHKMERFTKNVFSQPWTPNTDSDGNKVKETYESLGSLCHAWASENVMRGRSGGSMFFENGIIYSYGHHYEAAKIFTNKKLGKKIVLQNSVDYSTSTQNHLREINMATKHIDKIRVPDVDPTTKADHESNITYLSDLAMNSCVNIFLNKRYSHPDSACEYFHDIKHYCEMFNLKTPLGNTKDLIDLLDDCQKVTDAKYLERDIKAKERELKKELELKEKYSAQLETLKHNFPSRLTDWRNGTITTQQLKEAMRVRVYIPAPFGRTKTHHVTLEENDYSYIRIMGETVETSDHADVPLSHALRLLDLIEKREAKKGARVGHYILESVSNQDKEPVVVTIGCHKILLSEARQVLKEHKDDKMENLLRFKS